jgi:glycosyltransferase involved in cell wall biosynthesis
MTDKPVILQIIPELSAGGAERTVIEVAEAIVAAGGKALVATKGGRLEAELKAVGGEFIRFSASTKNPLAIYANARRLETFIARRRINLIHARSRAPAWSALIAARRAKIPFVTTYHGIYNQKNSLKGFYNSVMARGDIIIANSHYTASIVKKRHGIPETRLHVIPRGVDLERFSPNRVTDERIAALRRHWGVSAKTRLIVLAARLTGWKGQRVAIEAAPIILNRPEFADVVFILAGDDQGRTGYREALAARIEELGLTGRILLPGHCEDMPAAFKTATLALVPSIEPEAFGRISIEAQAMGCPVLVSGIGALPETIIEASEDSSASVSTGWSFSYGDEQALAFIMMAALSLTQDQRAAIGAAAQKNAARFSKTVLQRRTLRVYDQLLNTDMSAVFERK